MSDFDKVVAQAADHVRRRSVSVNLRHDLLERHEELDRRLLASDASSLAGPPADLAAEIGALEEEIEANLVVFTFRSMGALRWANLMGKHPPTKAQLKDHPNLDHNPETFPFVAMAETCETPDGGTVDTFRQLAESLSVSVFNQIWTTCVDATVGGSGAPKSAAAGAIRRLSAQYASTPAPAASPDQSSSAESSG